MSGMHLMGHAYSTINTRKRKKRDLTPNQLAKLETEWRQYNKSMRKANSHSAQFDTLEEYIAYTRGEYKPKAQKSVEFREYQPQENVNYRSTDHIPSVGMGVGVAARKESIKYTGDLIVGIGTMHKSNAVPIMRGTNEAKEIAAMRR